MNKWSSSLQDTPKPVQYQPKLLNMEPAYGFEGTIITLVLQELSCPSIKLAFNSLVVETKQLQSQGMTSLVATVPSFEMTLSTSSVVPISICFLEKDMIQDTIFIANFTYQSNNTITNTANNDPNNEMVQRGRKRSIISFMNDISNPNKRVYQGITEDAFSNYLPSNNTYNSIPLSSYPYYQQRADNSSSNSTIKQHDYYSTTSSASSSPLSSPQLSSQPSSYYPNQPQPSTTIQTRKSYHRPTVHSLKSTSHQPSTSVANYQPYPGLVSQNNLELVDDLDTMMQHWTPEECQQGRRLVRFWRQDNAAEDDVIRCHCEPIAQQDPAATDTNNTVVSCIYCPDRNDYFITSVDCIYLLESLMNTHFGVEEKNRIRRNLEGFRPITVAKCKPKSADFFKLVMSFPHPKPRNIEKDIKAFTWKILPYALKKIIMKYTVTSSSTSSSIGRLLPSPSSSPASTNIVNNNSNNNKNDNNKNQYQSNIMNCLSSKKYPTHTYESTSSSSLPPTSLTTSSSSTTTTSISSLVSSTSTSSSSPSFSSSFPTPPSMINEDIHPQPIASTDKQQYYYHPSSTNPPVYGLPPPPSSSLPLQDRPSYLPTSSPALSVSSPQLAYIPHSSSTPTTSTFMDDINNPITPTTTSFPIDSTTTAPYPIHTSSSSSSSMILPPPSNNFMSQLTIDGVTPYDSNILTSYIS